MIIPATKPTLSDLAAKHNVDKLAWGYMPTYQRLFDKLPYDLRILEFGIRSDCRSLRMWREHRPNATIIGVDMHPRSGTFKLYCGRQEDPELINQLVAEDKFHLIVDDAGHRSSAQVPCFNAMFGRVLPGGYYTIEDIHLGLTSHYNDGPISVFEFLNHLNEIAAIPAYADIPTYYNYQKYKELLARQTIKWGDAAAHLYHIESIELCGGMVVIGRR